MIVLPAGTRIRLLSVIAPLIFLLDASVAVGQGPAASPVRWTQARSEELRRSVHLPGTAEAQSRSVVASQVSGLVVERLAEEGHYVTAGEVLARLDEQDLRLRLDVAKGLLDEALARQTQVRNALTRSEDLFERKLSSDAEMDEARARVLEVEARLARLTAEIDRIELDLRRCRIVAPFDGIVVAELTEQGEWLSVGDPVAELLSLDSIDVRVEVAEQHFPRLRVGDTATVVFEALPGTSLEGRISARIPSADPRARTFPVLVKIPNPERRIAVGMLANVMLPLGELQSAVLIPKDAVVRQGAQEFVWIIDEADAVQQVGVDVGEGYGAWVVAQGGVSAGQRVVTRGNERLRPGQTVAGEPLEYDLP